MLGKDILKKEMGELTVENYEELLDELDGRKGKTLNDKIENHDSIKDLDEVLSRVSNLPKTMHERISVLKKLRPVLDTLIKEIEKLRDLKKAKNDEADDALTALVLEESNPASTETSTTSTSGSEKVNPAGGPPGGPVVAPDSTQVAGGPPGGLTLVTTSTDEESSVTQNKTHSNVAPASPSSSLALAVNIPTDFHQKEKGTATHEQKAQPGLRVPARFTRKGNTTFVRD